MRNTAILQPLDSEHLQHQINYKHVYQPIQNQLTQIKPKDGHITFLDFLEKLDITEEVYILALCSSLEKPKVFLKREVQDMYTNCYMRNMLSA